MFLHQGSHVEIRLIAAPAVVRGRRAASRVRRLDGGIVVVVTEACVRRALPKGGAGRGTRGRSRRRTFRHALLRNVGRVTGERTERGRGSDGLSRRRTRAGWVQRRLLRRTGDQLGWMIPGRLDRRRMVFVGQGWRRLEHQGGIGVGPLNGRDVRGTRHSGVILRRRQKVLRRHRRLRRSAQGLYHILSRARGQRRLIVRGGRVDGQWAVSTSGGRRPS